jgi:hypothetical protein
VTSCKESVRWLFVEVSGKRYRDLGNGIDKEGEF